MFPNISASKEKELTQSQELASSNEAKIVLAKGRYVKKHLIGSGSYGTVFLAKRDDSLKKDYVALKIARRNGEIEVGALSKLNPHRNIVTLLDYSISGSEVCLALELGDCSLNKLVGLWGKQKIQLTVGQLNFFLTELLEAYQYVHSKGLLGNTDLSEGNVLYFKSENRLKLTDFGVDWGGKDVQSKIGKLAYYVLTRLSHNCDALPYEGRAAFCSEQCSERIFSEPDFLCLDWQKGLDEKQIELIINLCKGGFSMSEVTSLLKDLSENIEFLPAPETLVSGEELKPFDWESYFLKKKLKADEAL